MRCKTLPIICFLLTTTNLLAVWNDATFTSDNEIVDGDTYVRVSVYDSAGIPTTITVSGGQLATLFSYENSVVNITGGSFSSEYYSYHPENNDGDGLYLCPSEYHVYAHDRSTVNYSGGSLGTLACEDWATLNIDGGTARVVLSDNATVNISGGEINNINPHRSWTPSGAGNAHLYATGGNFTGPVMLPDDFIMEVFGYDFSYEPDGGISGPFKGASGGLLHGYWPNGTPFSINFADFPGIHSYDNVILHTIPEPNTFILLACISIALRKKAVG